MGTNYYLHEKPSCPTCDRDFESRHIGKSSAGWCFALHVIPEDGINDLPDWQRLWSLPGAKITNEYGDTVTPDDMLRAITQRGRGIGGEKATSRWYADNHAEPGPNGLARHRIGRRCLGHGEGTWDLILGEFS